MIYFFTENQWDKYWVEPHSGLFESATIPLRIRFFTEIYGTTLIYNEESNSDDPAFYGSIEGNEKDINWYLLTL